MCRKVYFLIHPLSKNQENAPNSSARCCSTLAISTVTLIVLRWSYHVGPAKAGCSRETGVTAHQVTSWSMWPFSGPTAVTLSDLLKDLTVEATTVQLKKFSPTVIFRDTKHQPTAVGIPTMMGLSSDKMCAKNNRWTTHLTLVGGNLLKNITSSTFINQPSLK